MDENKKNEPIEENEGNGEDLAASARDSQGEEPLTHGEEDIRAFKTEWSTDGGEQSEEEPGSNPEEEPEEEKPSEPAAEDDTETNHIQDAASDKPKREKTPKQLTLASVLSACSIVLLVAFALSLMLGIFPLNMRGSYGYVANMYDTADMIEEFLSSVVTVKTASTSGTGVIIREDGYIVTNYHVIEENETSVTVRLYGEDTAIKAKVVGFHAGDDVAVLKIDRKNLRAASFADSSKVQYGETVYAIGNPEGSDFDWSVTQGIVSSPMRQLMEKDSEGILIRKINVVQTDASVNHGNSGGALINIRGELVGIVSLKRIWSQQGNEPVEGMGFALPASGVLIDVKAIIEKGNANGVNSGIIMPRPLMGITGVGVTGKQYYENYTDETGSGVKAVDEEYAKANPQTTFYAAITGVHVSATSTGSDAAKYLKPGDIITEVNGNYVDDIHDVMDIVNKFDGGDKITVKYYRDGKYYTAELTLRTAAELDQ